MRSTDGRTTGLVLINNNNSSFEHSAPENEKKNNIKSHFNTRFAKLCNTIAKQKR